MFVKTYSLKSNESVVLEDFGGKNRSKTENLILFSLALQ